jgi:hypothetical protein
MSAFVVSKRHIDAIVRWAVQRDMVYGYEHGQGKWRHLTFEDADWLGRMLWAENVTSVEYRYPDTAEGGEYPGPIGFLPDEIVGYKLDTRTWVNAPVSAVQVLKLCHSLDYQSCEHDGWKTSYAKEWLDAIREAAETYVPGYAEAEWSL